MGKRFEIVKLGAVCLMLTLLMAGSVFADNVDLKPYCEGGKVKMQIKDLSIDAEEFRLLVFSDAELDGTEIWVITSAQGYTKNDLRKRFVRGEAEGEDVYVIEGAENSVKNAVQLFCRDGSKWIPCSDICISRRKRNDDEVTFNITFDEPSEKSEQTDESASGDSSFILLNISGEKILVDEDQVEKFYADAEKEKGYFIETAHDDTGFRFKHILTEEKTQEEGPVKNESNAESSISAAESPDSVKEATASDAAGTDAITGSQTEETQKEAGGMNLIIVVDSSLSAASSGTTEASIAESAPTDSDSEPSAVSEEKTSSIVSAATSTPDKADSEGGTKTGSSAEKTTEEKPKEEKPKEDQPEAEKPESEKQKEEKSKEEKHQEEEAQTDKPKEEKVQDTEKTTSKTESTEPETKTESKKEAQTEAKITEDKEASEKTESEAAQEINKESKQQKKHIFGFLNELNLGGMVALLIIIAALLFAVTVIKQRL